MKRRLRDGRTEKVQKREEKRKKREVQTLSTILYLPDELNVGRFQKDKQNIKHASQK